MVTAPETRTQGRTTTLEGGAPTSRMLTPMQVSRLSALSGVDTQRLGGKTVAQISKELAWEIDPELLLFRKVCGKVVKSDPGTGMQHPVPNATVNVYDTEDEIWGYFPLKWPYGWLFPTEIREEKIATVQTDACGNFCVWICAFDIDWIVQWRRERICLWDFLVRPTVANLLAQLAENEARLPFPPAPPGDPLLAVASTRADVGTLIGAGAQQVLERRAPRGFGASTAMTDRILRSPAFGNRVLPPPLPQRETHGPAGNGAARATNGSAAARLDQLPIPPEKRARLDLNNYVGPFLRCFDVEVPEWYEFVETPDIEFEVTQNLAGADVVIYDGYFDVPWGSSPIPEVILEASPIAVASPVIECAPGMPCTATPAVEMLGLVRATPAYIDSSSGLSVRTEPPKLGGTSAGTPTYPASSPFCGELQVYGCPHIATAAYYRIQGEFAAGSGVPAPATFTPIGPMVSHWPVFPPGAPTQTVTCDTAGWYAVQPDDVLPSHLLLDWYPSGNGVYRFTIEVGDSSKNVIATSATFVFAYNDSAPAASFSQLGYTIDDPGASPLNLGLQCAQIARVPGHDVYVHISALASSPHLRSASLSAYGCGTGGNPTLEAGTPDWWYQSASDTTASPSAVFKIDAAMPAGCYTFDFVAASRAFSPAGADGYYQLDWWNDETTWRYSEPQISVSVIDT